MMSRTRMTNVARTHGANILVAVRDAINSDRLEAPRVITASLDGAIAALTETGAYSKRSITVRSEMMNMATDSRVIGYVRVSTDEQAASGAGLAAQRKAIRAEVARRGWTLIRIVGEESGASSATLDRAGLQDALDTLDRGEADVLVVAKLDRLSRSVAQGAQVMDQAKRRGWSMVALDFGLDTTTPAGEMVANVILSTAQYERRLIGQRTKAALAEKRAQGIRLGRPTSLNTETVERIVNQRREGASLRIIAESLNADDVPTANARRGSTWHASSVRAVLDGHDRGIYADHHEKETSDAESG